MGRAAAGQVAGGLIAAGRHPDTPVLIVVNASLPHERTVHGRLSALAFLVETISDNDPTVLLVGEAMASPHATRQTRAVIGASQPALQLSMP
jgi:uroporphyrin-III C-methyltransferase